MLFFEQETLLTLLQSTQLLNEYLGEAHTHMSQWCRCHCETLGSKTFHHATLVTSPGVACTRVKCLSDAAAQASHAVMICWVAMAVFCMAAIGFGLPCFALCVCVCVFVYVYVCIHPHRYLVCEQCMSVSVLLHCCDNIIICINVLGCSSNRNTIATIFEQ